MKCNYITDDNIMSCTLEKGHNGLHHVMPFEQRSLLAPNHSDVVIVLNGARYFLKCDPTRERNAPAWYVQRQIDRRYSTRNYSRPEGAFNALVNGAIVWE